MCPKCNKQYMKSNDNDMQQPYWRELEPEERLVQKDRKWVLP